MFSLRSFAVVFLLSSALGAAELPPIGDCRPPAAAPGSRTAVLLAINDVYRIEGVEGGTIGGLARLRTLRRELEREHPDLLLLHGGDLLFPSLLSRTYWGEQMIDVLNLMDGDPQATDQRDRRMFAVFGNHELDQRSWRDAALLQRRVAQSQFAWLGTNVVFVKSSDGVPAVSGDNVLEATVVESGGLRIGLFGLTLPTAGVDYVKEFKNRTATAREVTAKLRRQGAEVVVALTHSNARDDRRLLADLEDQGPDLIIGGHDHQRLLCRACRRWVIKADADARTASVVWLTLPPAGPLQVDHCYRALTGVDLPPDSAVQARVNGWLARHDRDFCAKQGKPAGCLGEALGHTRTLLDAEEYKIRGEESSLGNWIADQMVAAFKDCGAQAAFINSGGLRLNQDVPPGPILRSHLEELFQYETDLYLLSLKGKTLQQVIDRSIVGWPGAGNWLQISGFSYTHEVAAQKATNLLLGPAGSGRSVEPDEDLKVVVNGYLIDATKDQDGYTMLSSAQVVQGCPANGLDLKEQVVVPALAKAGPNGIAPVTEGRIRQSQAAGTDICAGEDAP